MAATKEISLLSEEHIEEFHRRGVLVVSGFLSADEVHEARQGELSLLKEDLLDYFSSSLL